MREKAHPDRSFLTEVSIYRNNQNMIPIVAVRPNSDDGFLSPEYNGAHLYYVNENGSLADPNFRNHDSCF
jgi:hypothetical protein